MLRVRFEPSNLRQQLFSVPGSLPWRHTGEEKKQIENPWTLERKDGQFISKKTALFPLFFLPAHATHSTSLRTLVQSSRFSKPGNIFFFWLSSHLLFKVQAGCLSSGGLSQTGTGWLISILLSIPCLPSKQPYEHVLNQHPTQHETEFMCTLNKKTLKIIFFSETSENFTNPPLWHAHIFSPMIFRWDIHMEAAAKECPSVGQGRDSLAVDTFTGLLHFWWL